MDTTLPQPGPDLCSEEEVAALVHGFYARVREDDMLGPVFAARVHDWDTHMAHLVDFWSALLRGTRRFNGSPMGKHMAIDELSQALFERWLRLFRDTTASLGNPEMEKVANEAAARIADNFWRRFQMSRWPPLPLHGRGS